MTLEGSWKTTQEWFNSSELKDHSRKKSVVENFGISVVWNPSSAVYLSSWSLNYLTSLSLFPTRKVHIQIPITKGEAGTEIVYVTYLARRKCLLSLSPFPPLLFMYVSQFMPIREMQEIMHAYGMCRKNTYSKPRGCFVFLHLALKYLWFIFS